MNLLDLTGEVAVVLGATGVLGGAIAEGLAAAGAKVAVLGRNAERGESESSLASTKKRPPRIFSRRRPGSKLVESSARRFVEPVGRSDHSGERRGRQRSTGHRHSRTFL